MGAAQGWESPKAPGKGVTSCNSDIEVQRNKIRYIWGDLGDVVWSRCFSVVRQLEDSTWSSLVSSNDVCNTYDIPCKCYCNCVMELSRC